ncbi:hypothetical protein VUR80DRAFT_9143 [Thermomyces stellatus]
MPVPIEEEPSEGRSSSASASDGEPPRPPASTNYFAPPFYGRPGAPLRPSPSITSLLIPSRPTTPDASDAEDKTPPSTDRRPPQVPTYEYYGFVLYLFSSLTFGVYLLWSYLPSPFLHALGIEYYPNRWWSLAVPAWVVMALVYIFVALGSYNVGYLTPSVGSVETVVDDAGFVAVLDGKGRKRRGGGRKKVDYREVWGHGTDGVMDVPLGGVCEILHGGPEPEEEEDAEEGKSWLLRVLEL